MRVSVAVVLLSVASAVVALALPSQSPAWLSSASVLALLCGWAAARIIYTELVQSRRDNAADRAAQAQAYRTIFAERSFEHAEFTSSMVHRLGIRDREITELTSHVVDTERRAAEAETRVQREARRANDADARVVELRHRIEELEAHRAAEAERFDQLASWEGFETVVDMMAWEQTVAAAHQAGTGPEHEQAQA